MTIIEFYEAVGGSYDDIVTRMMGEARVRKYLGKFSDNTTFSKLEQSIKDCDYENAFLEAHNLKGMSLNIGVTELAEAASDLTEALRGGPKGDVNGLFEIVKEKYDKTVGLMQTIEEQDMPMEYEFDYDYDVVGRDI